MRNPYPDPLAGRSGYIHELLASLTPEEIKQYIAHCRWSQANTSLLEKPDNVYQSKQYYMYRTNQHIYNAQNVLAENDRKNRLEPG